MNLFKKEQSFSDFFLCIFEIYIKSSTFSKKYDPHGWFVSEITDSEKHGEIIV